MTSATLVSLYQNKDLYSLFSIYLRIGGAFITSANYDVVVSAVFCREKRKWTISLVGSRCRQAIIESTVKKFAKVRAALAERLC